MMKKTHTTKCCRAGTNVCLSFSYYCISYYVILIFFILFSVEEGIKAKNNQSSGAMHLCAGTVVPSLKKRERERELSLAGRTTSPKKEGRRKSWELKKEAGLKTSSLLWCMCVINLYCTATSTLKKKKHTLEVNAQSEVKRVCGHIGC